MTRITALTAAVLVFAAAPARADDLADMVGTWTVEKATLGGKDTTEAKTFKALKMTIGPVQERIPIYIAAIGPKNTQLTGEIADGWLPTFFSPEHVADFRGLLEEGAARAGNGKAIDGSFQSSTRHSMREQSRSTQGRAR